MSEQQRIVNVPMPRNLTIQVFPSDEQPGMWKAVLRATAIDVGDGQEWGGFGAAQYYDHDPTIAELKALVVAWLEHEVEEQLGMKPHDTWRAA